MKKLFTIFVLMISISTINAQYTSSGVGTKFSPQMLADSAGAFFTIDGNNYQLSNLITISANDTLEIIDADTIFMASDAELRIEGVLWVTPDEELAITAVDSTLGYEGITFDNSEGSKFENTHFSFGGGVKLLYSDVHFIYCNFYKMTDANGSGAINMLHSNPAIGFCNFQYNYQSAISSSATASSSPSIMYCELYRNNTENGNRPQINLGTSDGSNGIVISSNTIEGFYDEAGGISVATLAGGSAIVEISGNLIKGNRYGINIQGDVDAQIIGNQLIDNNIEDNPMAGGSGISFYSGCTATVAHNIITGNLWGITIPNAANPNLGQIGTDTLNIGHNYIYDNGNGGVTYNLYNNSTEEIYAQNNYWGTSSAVEAGEGIIDNADNSALGVVHYEPIYLLSDESQVLSMWFLDNDEWLESAIDEVNNHITIELPAATDLSLLRYAIEVSDYASYEMSNDELQNGIGDFTSTVILTVTAEDSVSASTYTIDITSAQSINQNEIANVNLYPNPARDNILISADKTMKSIVVSDSYGREVQTYIPRNMDYRVDVSSYASSIYFIRIIFEDESQIVKKIVVE
ncbi:MAG: hypothetical protein C0599_06960 [Salinivirgaceae bacterium]|nr:MAG: hypothetical protein C0599_06960 [Salinivirgaceae bacterium]